MNRYAPRPRRPLAAWLAAIGLLLMLLSGCRGSRPQPDERVNAGLVAGAVGLRLDKVDSSRTAAGQRVQPASAPVRLLEAVGLSTPAGRARRQAVRLARAAAPRVGKGGVLAINSQVAHAYKATAPATAAAPGASVNNAAANSQQQAVNGNENELSAKKQDTIKEPPGPLAVLADNLTAWVPYVAVGLVLLVGLVLWRKKKQAEILIP